MSRIVRLWAPRSIAFKNKHKTRRSAGVNIRKLTEALCLVAWSCACVPMFVSILCVCVMGGGGGGVRHFNVLAHS